MIRPRVVRDVLAGWLLLSAILVIPPPGARGQPAARPAGPVPGQFLPIVEPITSETVAKVEAAAHQFINQNAARGVRPVLVFEFQPGEAAPDSSRFGSSYELADLISRGFEGGTTVAYVPRPLSGFAVLAALACDDVVMGTDASLGPITPAGKPYDRAHRGPVQELAIRKGRDPALLLGMLEPESDLRAVRTDDNQLRFVTADKLAEFRATHAVKDDRPAWDAGRRGVLTSARAREQGFVKLQAENPADVARYYNMPGQSSADDPTLGQVIRPVWIQIQGPVDTVKKSYLSRRIEQARQERVNLVFFQFNSQGGLDTAADAVADMIANIKDMKTVAFVDDRALGVAALPALACTDIVIRKGGQIGDVHQLVTGRNGQVQELDERQVVSLARRAANLAELKGHPVAIARAMVDPNAVVVEAKDARTGTPCFVLQSQVASDPGRYLDPEVRKEAGHVLTISDKDVVTYGLGQAVGEVEELKGLYGLRGKAIRVDGPTWVDSLVTILTDPFVSWLLLFIGLFMLVLELKLPGIGLPAIASSLAFLLFFWSHYLSGTADQLEIILFLVGMVCLALELFVFPGFGVFGMSGVLLILTSIVMASHTFVWPTQDYEYREMGYTLIQVTAAMAGVACGAVILARYFPSLPLFNRLVLKPEPWTGDADADPAVKPSLEGFDSLAYLVGETGRTTTVLRPSGKARFGEHLIDVTADGFYIEPDSLVEVIDVQGSKVVVKRLDA
jgi:membrane-bound serine protease (ClpP class)